MSYEQWLKEIAPVAFQQDRGQAYLAAFGRVLDEEVNRLREAILARFVEHAPTAGLARIGSDRRLHRYPAESEASFRRRLAGAWAFYQWGGTIRGLEEALRAAGYDSIIVEEHWRTDPNIWAEFSIILDAADAFLTAIPWDSGYNWDDGHHWDADLDPGEPERIRRVIDEVKPARSKLRNLHYVYLPGFTWGVTDPCWNEPGVTWNTLLDWS